MLILMLILMLMLMLILMFMYRFLRPVGACVKTVSSPVSSFGGGY
jgi:hypothetical protein